MPRCCACDVEKFNNSFSGNQLRSRGSSPRCKNCIQIGYSAGHAVRIRQLHEAAAVTAAVQEQTAAAEAAAAAAAAAAEQESRERAERVTLKCSDVINSAVTTSLANALFQACIPHISNCCFSLYPRGQRSRAVAVTPKRLCWKARGFAGGISGGSQGVSALPGVGTPRGIAGVIGRRSGSFSLETMFSAIQTFWYVFPSPPRSMYIVYHETENHNSSKVHAIVMYGTGYSG